MPKAANDKSSAKAKPRPKKVNGYKFPEKLPPGEVLRDLAKKEWKLGTSIGQGGFGEIYSASAVGETSRNETYVIKIEPHENGPLFVERNFYIKIAKPNDVEAWMKEQNLKVLGIPGFYGSGSHEYNNIKYRFIVIERYGRDLWSIFLNNNKKFPPTAVYKCAIQIIDVLHYIHDKGYVHGDIKGANLLLGLRKGTENHVFLVDFGLACKYNTKEFKKDPKKAHNGTIEYTSRDWHIGVPTRRGDMEILGYNLLHWLGSTLPWESDLTNPEKVHEKKRLLMENVSDQMKKTYPQVPKVIGRFLEYVFKLQPDEQPDYKFCKDLFLKELKNSAGTTNGKLDFGLGGEDARASTTPKKKTPRTKKKQEKDDPELADTPKKTPQRKRKSEQAQAKVEVDSGDESDDIFLDTPTPKKVTKKAAPKAKKKALPETDGVQKPSWRDAPLIDHPILDKGTENTKIVKKTVTKRQPKKEQPAKASWRDAPAVKASNVSRPGEYSKKDKATKKI